MRILYVSLIVVIIDQISKLCVKGFSLPFFNIHAKGMTYAEKIEVLGSFFRITYVENPGMAFGIDIGEASKLLLSIFTIIASIGILWYIYKSKDEGFLLRFSLALILGGALGNLIDRSLYGILYGYAPLFYGSVVDFLDFDFFDISIFGVSYDRWPIFNIADVAVSLGVILLLFSTKKETESVNEITKEKELAGNDEDQKISEIGVENAAK